VPEGRHPPSGVRLPDSGGGVCFFDFFGDDSYAGGEGFVVLGIVHADTLVLVLPIFLEAGEEIVAGDNQDAFSLEPLTKETLSKRGKFVRQSAA
jgi:hypothetical protein